MRLFAVSPQRFRPRYGYLAAITTTGILFRSWLYAFIVIMHCFLTWSLRIGSVNYVGTNNDGFTLDLEGLPPPPNIDISALISARITASNTSASPADRLEARLHIQQTTESLAWGPQNNDSFLIPPIIHQVTIGMSGPPPQKWLDASQACRAIHPDYTFMTWNDVNAQEFIAKEYPWFLETWLNYPYTIQKADSIRYLALYTYGGAYLDMDLYCKRPLDPLRKLPFVTPSAHPVGLSNSIILSTPHHPFTSILVQNLPTFNHYFFSSYPTVMFSTGCMYLSALHTLYPQRSIDTKVLGGERNRVNGRAETPLFTHLGASSWHQGDAQLFVLIGRWIKETPLGAYALLLALSGLLVGVWCVYSRRKTQEFKETVVSVMLVSEKEASWVN
ncbi:uncharacterized protein SPPG_04541 [Spizellomyces punctatus DAOM BR117]|uniref:Glycosyltransferase family 32 protein n=1 Tax=Spizellomyces punctatus (strain DAOM BR117) TaxID=645134 RepID=A0A0L0HH48_SPIPD|nr:hypothetical protein, variant [Spizellomyces punctatus DAOM BR117]XP_016608245.1 uncharacterized protein SPPG_04541 [Spizellomyces punctatus DAOM BR117]KND00205.1 hypothetical protein, variant [Spizellomyces punctatus DAOM BR117]KND00206.1 hypothetical protein SPPG_04541 [Spizellomyces punctatus DAOM BR117]|eukprot:XP_016608244.1 hypothetical protein, variant [Spizellomyces punctatus DAOM BR117]